MESTISQTGFFPKLKSRLRSRRSSGSPVIRVTILLLVILVIFSVYKISTIGLAAPANKAPTQVQKAATTSSRASFNINHEFTFPLRGEKDEEIAKFKFNIGTSELKDQVVLQKQPVTLTDGRVFLTVNFKVTNDTKQDITINTRRYFRLTTNNNDKEPLAPSIYNDPVIVQAISVTPVSIGFIVNETDKDLKLKVGEINGEKTTIDLQFPGK